MRVPTINVSVVDLTFQAARNTSKEEITEVLKAASEGFLKGILEINNRPLVSVDFNHNPASSIYEEPSTIVMDGNFVKVLSWYDNEWGFSNRMLDTTIALINAE
jgi:glyceraldehyde 3-phosphate dehydrogenase